MAVEEYVRLAWYADREGRPGMRDALLTLAVAESGPEHAVLAERCRRRLVAGRPEHWYASFPTLGEALSHPKVVEALREIRAVYPPVRVRQLLLRGEARRGPYRGRTRALARVVDDLIGIDRPAGRSGETPALPMLEAEAAPESAFTFYLTVLLAIAILLAAVQGPQAQGTKAA